MVIPHKFEGIYTAKGPSDSLVTKSFAPGESVYNEKRITIEVIFILLLYFFI
jgi:rRNA 2'-O-methyltransferase fibrillarin